jgi:hypothetical protein
MHKTIKAHPEADSMGVVIKRAAAAHIYIYIEENPDY